MEDDQEHLERRLDNLNYKLKEAREFRVSIKRMMSVR
jgi:hypothetical protein